MIEVQDGKCNGKSGYVSDVHHLVYCKNQLKKPTNEAGGILFQNNKMSTAVGNRAVELLTKGHCRHSEFILVLRKTRQLHKREAH